MPSLSRISSGVGVNLDLSSFSSVIRMNVLDGVSSERFMEEARVIGEPCRNGEPSCNGEPCRNGEEPSCNGEPFVAREGLGFCTGSMST